MPPKKNNNFGFDGWQQAYGKVRSGETKITGSPTKKLQLNVERPVQYGYALPVPSASSIILPTVATAGYIASRPEIGDYLASTWDDMTRSAMSVGSKMIDKTKRGINKAARWLTGVTDNAEGSSNSEKPDNKPEDNQEEKPEQTTPNSKKPQDPKDEKGLRSWIKRNPKKSTAIGLGLGALGTTYKARNEFWPGVGNWLVETYVGPQKTEKDTIYVDNNSGKVINKPDTTTNKPPTPEVKVETPKSEIQIPDSISIEDLAKTLGIQ